MPELGHRSCLSTADWAGAAPFSDRWEALSEVLRRRTGLLAYKAPWYGLEFVEADRWYPSSKTCSRCGQVDAGLTLADRTYQCPACGLVLDRDVNAAVNLARWPDQQNTASPHAA